MGPRAWQRQKLQVRGWGWGRGAGGAREPGGSFRGTSASCWRRISPGGRSSWRSGRGVPPQGTRCQTPLPVPEANPGGDYRAEGIQRSLVRYRCVHSGPDSRLPACSPGRLSEGVLLKKAALFSAVANPGFLPAFLRSSSWPGLCAFKPIASLLLRVRPIKGGGGKELSLCPRKPESLAKGIPNVKSAPKAGTPASANRGTQAWTILRKTSFPSSL